ncbi:hypothetical protein BD414DRAFT_167879 [Trametes punicea]|nr:hypothetical protein BD414DRAFT_167879 [Trametes punicea]
MVRFIRRLSSLERPHDFERDTYSVAHQGSRCKLCITTSGKGLPPAAVSGHWELHARPRLKETSGGGLRSAGLTSGIGAYSTWLSCPSRQ